MNEARRVYHSILWRRISRYVKSERAGGACEHCGALDGAISADGRSIIRLDCAHLNGDVHDLRLENLRALCPTCHYFYDQMRRVRTFFDRHPELQGVLEPRGPARARTAGSRKVAKAQRTADGETGRRGDRAKRRTATAGSRKGAKNGGGKEGEKRRAREEAKRRTATAGSRKDEKAQRTGDGGNGERQRHDLNTEGLAAGPWHGIDSTP
jgi:hypothetical protein